MILSIMMHPMKYTHTSAKSPDFPNSIGLLTFLSRSKPSWCSSYWKWSHLAPKSVWPHCWLACSPWWPPPCYFYSSSRDKVWRPFCPPCWCRCWRACLFPFFLFLFSSSPILHLALIGLVAFLVAHVANHGLSFIKLLHSLNGVILMILGLLYFAFLLESSPW